MKIYVAIVVILMGFCGGCTSNSKHNGDAALYVDRCIQQHLNSMAEADSIQYWDKDLYEAICVECEKLYGIQK